jgi:hypothetical protein
MKKFVALDPKSLGETARSISKARISVKSRALILIHRQRRFKKILDMILIIGYNQRKK